MGLHITKKPQSVKFKDIPIGTCFILADVDNPSSVHFKINALQCLSISSQTGYSCIRGGISDTEEFVLTKVTGIDVKAEEI